MDFTLFRLKIAASRTVKLGGTVATVGFPDSRSSACGHLLPSDGRRILFHAFKKKFRCFSLTGISSFSITASMSSHTRRFSLNDWLRSRYAG